MRKVENFSHVVTNQKKELKEMADFLKNKMPNNVAKDEDFWKEFRSLIVRNENIKSLFFGSGHVQERFKDFMIECLMNIQNEFIMNMYREEEENHELIKAYIANKANWTPTLEETVKSPAKNHEEES